MNMKGLRPIITAIALPAIALLLSQSLSADRTLRGKLRPLPTATATDSTAQNTALYDTVRTVNRADLRLSGYDKTLNSRMESLFVSNRLQRDITELELLITYSDMKGRMLHKAVRRIRAIVPAGETRRIEFSSWDKQNTFYYHKGRAPRTKNVTPYKVSCEVLSYIAPTDR